MTKTFSAAGTGGPSRGARSPPRTARRGARQPRPRSASPAAAPARPAPRARSSRSPAAAARRATTAPTSSSPTGTASPVVTGRSCASWSPTFNTEHPNIKVTMTAIAWAEYFQKLPAAVSNGKAPDIGIMHNDDLATNAARQVIEPLDDVATALKLTEADFAPIAWKGGLYKDKRYGIPLDIHPAGLFYNKTVMEKAGLDPTKPPTTGDELMTHAGDPASPRASRACGSRRSASTTAVYRAHADLPVRRQDGERRRADRRVRPTSRASRPSRGSRTSSTRATARRTPPADGDFVSFSNDKSAFMFNGPWNTTPLDGDQEAEVGRGAGAERSADTAGHLGRLAPVRAAPPDQARREQGRSPAGSSSTGSPSSRSAGPTPAWCPARNAVRDSAEFKALGPVTEFAKELDYIHFVPADPRRHRRRRRVHHRRSATPCSGKQPIADALGEAAERANKILAANKKKYAMSTATLRDRRRSRRRRPRGRPAAPGSCGCTTR